MRHTVHFSHSPRSSSALPSPANSPSRFRVFRVFRGHDSLCRLSRPFASFAGNLCFRLPAFNGLASDFSSDNVSPIACPPFPSPLTPPASATSAVSTSSPPLARPCERVPLTTGLHAATLRFFFLRDEHDRNPRAVARTHCGEPREVPLTIGCYRLRLAPVGRGATIGPISGSDLPPKPWSHRFVVGRRE